MELKQISPEGNSNSEPEVNKQLTGNYLYENNEELTTSTKPNLKQTEEEIEKAMTVSAYEGNQESAQLDQVYIFEPKMMELNTVSQNL